MKVKISNKIYIQEPSKELEQWVKESLTVKNPTYFKKERMGFWNGNDPEYLFLYEYVRGILCLPFGCLGVVWKFYPVKENYINAIKPVERLNYDSRINLYPYQKTAVERALERKNGILVMPCGAGKTQTGLELIAQIGGSALWLTHTQDLLHQSLKRAKEVLKQGGYGTITAGKVDVGTHITFATVQTMAKQDLSQFRDMFDVIICDECQHTAGSPTKVTQFYKVMSALCARYKIGLTATPKRADGLEVSMFALLGGVIHEVKREEIENTTCPVKVQTVYTHWFPKGNVYREDGQIDYAKVVDEMVNDEVRFQFVSDWINSIKEPCIVLANRVEYLKRLCEAFDGKAICLSGQGQSKKAKEERKAALMALNNGEIDCVFASYQIAAEGLDVPNLRYVVFATPEHNSTTVLQSAGRVGRKAEGKEYGTVIDFVDAFSMYQNWYKQRLKFYREIKAEV